MAKRLSVGSVLTDPDDTVKRPRTGCLKLKPFSVDCFIHYYLPRSYCSKYNTLLTLLVSSPHMKHGINRAFSGCDVKFNSKNVRFYNPKNCSLLFTLKLSHALHFLSNSYFAVNNVIIRGNCDFTEIVEVTSDQNSSQVSGATRMLEVIRSMNLLYIEKSSVIFDLTSQISINQLVINDSKSFLYSTSQSGSPETTDYLVAEKMVVCLKEPQLYSVLLELPTGTLLNKSLKELEITLKLILYDVMPDGNISRLLDNYSNLRRLTLRIRPAVDNSTEAWERPGPIQLLFNEIHYLIRHGVQVELVLYVPITEIYEENGSLEDILLSYVKLLIPHFSSNSPFAAHGSDPEHNSLYFNITTTSIVAHICVGEEECPLMCDDDCTYLL